MSIFCLGIHLFNGCWCCHISGVKKMQALTAAAKTREKYPIPQTEPDIIVEKK